MPTTSTTELLTLKQVAARLGVPQPGLASWLHRYSFVRPSVPAPSSGYHHHYTDLDVERAAVLLALDPDVPLSSKGGGHPKHSRLAAAAETMATWDSMPAYVVLAGIATHRCDTAEQAYELAQTASGKTMTTIVPVADAVARRAGTQR